MALRRHCRRSGLCRILRICAHPNKRQGDRAGQRGPSRPHVHPPPTSRPSRGPSWRTIRKSQTVARRRPAACRAVEPGEDRGGGAGGSGAVEQLWGWTMSERTKTCETCRFFDRQRGGPDDHEERKETGACRRRPPTINDRIADREQAYGRDFFATPFCQQKYNDASRGYWPWVCEGDWCGEWQSKEDV